MKGIVLAGGLGSRLQPLTQNDNKHYLPVYNKRMIEYPIETLVSAGIDEIILITGGQKPGQFLELLKNGEAYGIKKLFYTYQDGNGGIAAALKLAEPFVDVDESCVVILGDNYFEDKIEIKPCNGALISLVKVSEPWHFGIAEVIENKIISIEEKPQEAKSDLAIVGLYQFDYRVWRYLDQVSPSDRGELEITDILKLYMSDGLLEHHLYDGFWSDLGTFDAWMKVSQRIKERCES